MPTPIDGLGAHVADAFSGENLVFHAGAVVTTGVLVLSGADHAAHLGFSRGFENEGWNDTANIAGYVLPATAPALWIVGLTSDDRWLAGAGSAAVQALAVTIVTTGALKFATGRPHPVQDDAHDEPDHAREFSPFQNGSGAWPSGHTSSTISITAALTAYAPEKWWIPVVGYPLGLSIGLGMMDRDSHWASDLVAGALVGHVIGYSIGRNFRKRVLGETTVRDRFELVPLTGAAGMAVRGSW